MQLAAQPWLPGCKIIRTTHPVSFSVLPCFTGTLFASLTPGPSTQSSAQPHHGLSPAGSLGSASPSRTNSGTMLRLGLTRSLNSKKSSPNRVCCNALLAAYARATPPRWRQVCGAWVELGSPWRQCTCSCLMGCSAHYMLDLLAALSLPGCMTERLVRCGSRVIHTTGCSCCSTSWN